MNELDIRLCSLCLSQRFEDSYIFIDDEFFLQKIEYDFNK